MLSYCSMLAELDRGGKTLLDVNVKKRLQENNIMIFVILIELGDNVD